jgi:formate hydrogenlyase transcriptional activator
MRRFDGEYRWFLIRAEPVRDEHDDIVRWYGTSTDIEELKRAEKELRDLVDYLPQLIVILGPDGHRVHANRVTLDYFGRSLEDLQRAADFDRTVIHPEDFEKMQSLREKLSQGEPFEFETRMRGKEGDYRWFLFRYYPLRDCDERLLRWYTTATEIDDQKRAEERIKNENLALREEVDKVSMFEEIVGASSALQAVLSRVTKVAPTESTVLITGETGTGKELIARAIHKRSARSSRAFVSVNCAAIPQSLIASELFGHEKGAFTGALQRRVGRFEMAAGGTLFLDEVGELPCETQLALLRVLQERQFERVGGNAPIRADVRVISATNRDLKAAIAIDDFRSDLFYRLSVFPIEIPPLRERKDDISMLVEYFIDRYASAAGKEIRNISKKSMELLQSYPWPGNVRELQNVIERSVILCEGEIFSVDENWLSYENAEVVSATQPLVQTLATQERTMIEAALAETRGQVSGPSGAAARLSMRPSTLESKIRSLKIDKHRFKSSSAGPGSALSRSTRGRMPDSSRA